jgi:Zn-dependent protease
MGLQDRDYSRSNGGNDIGGFLRRLFFGEFYLGTMWGIRVRIHATLLLLLVFRVLFAGPMGFQTALISSAILFGIILLHEFGHCFAARSVGGRGDDVLLWPLGGLAFVHTPQRPWPSFVGTAGGPLVNVVICLVCAAALRITSGEWMMGNPLAPFLASMSIDLSGASFYLWWIYSTSLSLLLFNLLPIFPLDGGRLLQATLWSRLGYYRSMEIACITGMAGAVIMGLLSLGSLWMLFLWASCFMTCYQTKMNLRELADQAWEEERVYSGSYSGNSNPDRARVNLPRVNFGKSTSKPKDDRFTARDLNPYEWFARRKRRKQFEKLMRDD